MKTKYVLACLLLCSMLTGCVSCTVSAEETALSPMNRDELFSARDMQTTWDEQDVIDIALENTSITLTEKGVYRLSGQIENGQIVVDVPKEEKVQLILDGVSIHCESHAALYVKQADKVFITLAPGTENTLSCGETFTQTDENNVDAALFSKEDLTLSGEGTLVISSGGHGVVGKDEVTITAGTYRITSKGHGITAKDSLALAGGDFTLVSEKDGLHADHDEDETKGVLYIENGTFSITAQQDGIASSGAMEIAGGTFTLLCGGGSGEMEMAPSMQGMGGKGGRGGTPPGGFGGGRGGKGGFGGFAPGGWNAQTDTQEETTSQKGIKAGGNLLISGGTFTLDTADDALHTNGSMEISGGTFALETGDDGLHAEDTLTLKGGEITITECYEGLEGLHIRILSGNVTLTASDDGLNAAGGTDESGFGGGFGGGDRFGGFGFGGMDAGNGSIILSGGKVHITAYGDGIDANGYFQMDGGNVTVCGPTQGDTATLDYDTTAEINGGTFIGTGASGMMAQAFSGGTQGKIAVQVNNAAAGTSFTLKNADGKQILSHTPAMDYQVIILSSSDILPGETYTLQIGTGSGTFTAK